MYRKGLKWSEKAQQLWKYLQEKERKRKRKRKKRGFKTFDRHEPSFKTYDGHTKYYSE